MNCSFIVARYKPKGNIDSDDNFKENVERGTFDPIAYNCSAVTCQTEEEEKQGEEEGVEEAGSQGQDSPLNKLQNNLIPVKSRNVDNQNEILNKNEPQRYINLSFKTSQRLGSSLGSQGSHGHSKSPENYSKQLGPSNVKYNVKLYTGESQRQYVSNDVNQDEGRPRSLDYRAEIPRVSTIKVL